MFGQPSEEPPSSWLGALGQTFRSLENRGYRVYTAGQIVSMTGSAMQDMALSWVAYNMTRSALVLALVVLCTKLPILLFSLLGGKLADGYDRRRLIMATQWVEMAQAIVLAVLLFAGVLQVWMILVLSAVLGTAMAIELPARQAFVSDLVGGKNVVNAVSLNSVVFNLTRMVGPTLGAVLLVECSPGLCFAVNALSFAAALVSLYCLRTEGRQAARAHGVSGTVGAAVKFALGNSGIRKTLVLSLVLGFFGLQSTVLLPALAREVFPTSQQALGWLMASSSLGALVAGLVSASRNKKEHLSRNLELAAVVFPLALVAFALSGSLALSLLIELVIGVCITVQLTSANSAVQLSVPEEIRGRVMGLYNMVVLGSMPFGSLLMGQVADCFGAPLAVLVCAVVCGGAAMYYIFARDDESGTDTSAQAPVTIIAMRVQVNTASEETCLTRTNGGAVVSV